MAVDIRKINQRNALKSTVNILNPSSYTENPETWAFNSNPQSMTSPLAQQRNNLDRQVEVGLGIWLKEKLTPEQKQDYANKLTDKQWNQMQQYKNEGYSFEASKAMLENQSKMLDPTATWVNKFKDYNLKEQYYNNGYDIDPDSALWKTAQFLEKIGFKDWGNPITALSNNYNERYSNYLNSYTEEGDKAPWLARVPLSTVSSILWSAGKVSDMVWWLTEKADAGTKALLDRAILWLDTQASMYDETNRSVADYAWEWVAGGATGAFWVMAPAVMATFTAIWETAPGGAVLDAWDKLLRNAVTGIVENTPGIKSHYAWLDEQWKEDMIDSLVTGATLGILKWMWKTGKRAKNNTSAGKWLTQQQTYLNNLRWLFKSSLEEGIKESKFQSKVEWVNKATAEPVFENGKQVWKRGVFGDTKYATNRVVQAWIDAFKKNMQEGLEKGKRAKTQLSEVTGETPAGSNVKPESAGWAPTVTTSKWVVGKAKDIIETRVTGITPEEKIRIQNDPYVQEKFDKAMQMREQEGMPMEDSLITENLYNEIWDKILKTFDEIESQLDETSPVYKDIRNLNTTYSMMESLPEVNKLLDKNDIISTPNWLDFSNSKFISDADMRSVQRALDMITQTISKPLTPREYLNLRAKLSELAKYSVVDASRWQSLIRQMRHAVDQVAKKEIPGLKDLDKITSTKLKEIKDLKEGWVYKGGDRKGEIRNNFYSIIKNLTGENRKVMMNKLKEYYPGIDEEIEAVHLTQKLLKAYNKSPDIIKWLGLGWAIIWWIPGGIVPAVLWALVWEMIQEWMIRPWTKAYRKKAINKIVSEMSPEAKKKLEEIAKKQTYAKELSKEDQAVLERVTDLIQKERERSLSEEALKKRKAEQEKLNKPALPKVEPDVVDEKWNIKLARGTWISPVKSNVPRRITEINLSRPEVKWAPEEVQVIQDNLNIKPSVAEDIQESIKDFLEEIWANESWTINPKEVDYSKFSTESLNELYESDLPKIEKDKIEEELNTRIWEPEDKTAQEYAYRIRQIEEQEQRIGKVGKNKVNNAYKDKQMREWEAKKERLIEELWEKFWLDANGASDKYIELRDKPYSFIEEYKESPKFIDEQAERIVLDRLKAEWDKMPKFIKEMTEEQQKQRQDFIDKIKLNDWYSIETTPYNDRYVKMNNGQIVDRWAIRYVDWNVEIIAQDINGFLDSGIINYLPDDATLRISGEDTPIKIEEIRYGDTSPENKLIRKEPLPQAEQWEVSWEMYHVTPEDFEKFKEWNTANWIDWNTAFGTFVTDSKPFLEDFKKIKDARGEGGDWKTKTLQVDAKNVILHPYDLWSALWYDSKVAEWILIDYLQKVWRFDLDTQKDLIGLKFLDIWWETYENWDYDTYPRKDNYTKEDILAMPWSIYWWIKDTWFEWDDHNNYLFWDYAEEDAQKLRELWYDAVQFYEWSKDWENIYSYALFYPNNYEVAWSYGKASKTETDEPFDYITNKQYKKVDEMGINDVREGLELYKNAKYDMEARREFLILKQQPGYLEKLWLNRADVNKQIKERTTYSEGVKELSDELNKGVKLENQYLWLQNISAQPRLASNLSALKTLVKTVHGSEDGAYIPYMVNTILALNSTIAYDLLNIDAREVTKLKLTEEDTNGLYKPLTDQLFIGKEYQHTASHETVHYLDFLRWRELFGGSSQAPRYISNKMHDKTKLTPEQLHFYERFTKFVDSLEKVSKNNWKIILNDTFSSKPYWLQREEIFARFWEAFIDWVKKTAKDWVKQKDFKVQETEETEWFTLDHFKEFVNIIQEKAWLKWLKKARTPIEEFGSKELLGKRYREINAKVDQQSLFDENIDKKQLRRKWMDLIEKYRWNVIADVVTKYDPDIVEWKNNVNSQATLTQLYELKNIAEDLIKNNTDRTILENVEERMSSPSLILQDLIDRINKWKKQWISTYDKKQIQKIWYEMNSALAPRITDVSRYIKTIDSDVYESEFVPQVLYTIGKTYNPDIEVWQKNLKEPLNELIDQYPKRKTPNADTKIISDDALNGLKAKINELEKYSIKDIQNAFEWQEAEVFMRAVKQQIDKLNAEGMNNAVRDLVALHNMDYKNFEKQIKDFDGKSPMPSIAVMDPNVPHEVFGDLTLVFWKGTVDPKNNPDNKLYGSDAWTPMFPEIKEEWWIQYDVVKKFADDAVDHMIDNWVELDPSEAWYLASDLKNMIRELDERKDLKTNAYEYAEQIIEDLYNWWYEDFISNNEWAVIELQWKIEDFLESVDTSKKQFIPARYFKWSSPAYDLADLTDDAYELASMVKDRVKDTIAERYRNWAITDDMVLDMDKPADKNTMLVNYIYQTIYDKISKYIDKDWFYKAPADAPEKWETTSFLWFTLEIPLEKSSDIVDKIFWEPAKERPVTPENVLEAMKNQEIRREVEPGSFRDMIEIEWHELNDVEDVRKQNFAKVFHGDRTGDLWDLEKRYNNLIRLLAEDNNRLDWKMANDYNVVEDMKYDIKNSYDTDVSKFREKLKRFYPATPLEDWTVWEPIFREEILQRIIDVVEQGKKIPIRFSESKPERIVDLYNEVKYILVPKWDVNKAKEIVKGTPLENKLVEYTPNDKTAPRSRKLKELQKLYWDVFFSMWWVIMPIVMLQLMEEQIWWDSTATA